MIYDRALADWLGQRAQGYTASGSGSALERQRKMATPRGFRDISTTYQLAYATTDGNVQVRKIGTRLWEILARGGVSIYETSKKAALSQARGLSFQAESKQKARKRGPRKLKRKVRR